MRTRIALLGLLGLLATLLPGADLSGKWKGSFDSEGGKREMVFDLKADGNVVTGTVSGSMEKPAEIKDGKVQGADVTFWFLTEYQGNSYKLVFKGQVSGDDMTVTIGLDDGGWSTNFVAKKN